MKKFLVVALTLTLAACGAPLHTPAGKTYPTYGLFNEHAYKSKEVCYEIIIGNVVWGIILIETVIVPLYFLGFDLWQPVRLKHGPEDDCSIDG